MLATPGADAKSYCSNLEAGTTQAAVSAFYKCLATAKDMDMASACWQCYRSGSAASAAACYTCMPKVSPKNAIHCSHCWVPSKMAPGAPSAAQKCEQCIIQKDKAGTEPGACW